MIKVKKTSEILKFFYARFTDTADALSSLRTD